jgi:hypothetical protein
MNEDKKLVAYCGLYCGDCVNYKVEIADLARDLRKKLRQAKFDRVFKGLAKYFKEFKDYEKCYTVNKEPINSLMVKDIGKIIDN